MTNNEIKKAFEQFKKDLKKETGDEYMFTMNKRQIENRTATKTVCSAHPYKKWIEYYKDYIERIQNREDFTDEEKAEIKARDLKNIEEMEKLMAKFGTPRNEALATMKRIEDSKAFKKFEETVGKTTLTLEIDSEKFYKIRFRY